ncbi:IclR family transcriptional regulator [Burkholderia sp. SR8]|uniref:IclR family transcriptional regulator n=1 Tax=Burkholderia sp. SR8 TaxID=3062277 RepID=UPI00406485CF
MSNNVKRAFAILELLAKSPDGLRLQDISEALDLPVSAAHRHLAELIEMQYVRQGDRAGDAYVATTKLVSLGFTILSERGIVDFAQPILERLAHESGELVRLAVTDKDHLTFVARAQGARGGLLYDGDMGQEPLLFASATGIAWLSTKSDEEAVSLIVAQGKGPPSAISTNTPKTMKEVMARLSKARREGYGLALDSANVGINAIAVPVYDHEGFVLGTISIAGPAVRFTEARIEAIVGRLKAAAQELGSVRLGSPALTSRQGWAYSEEPQPTDPLPKLGRRG